MRIGTHDMLTETLSEHLCIGYKIEGANEGDRTEIHQKPRSAHSV